MPWAVRFRGKPFILDVNFMDEDVKALEAEMQDAEQLSGSFNIVPHEVIGVFDITFEESHLPNDLPFDGVHGFHMGDGAFGEVYIFRGRPSGHVDEVIVLYEIERELEPPENAVRFPLKEHSNENKGSKGQGELF